MELIIASTFAFAATNIDDLFLLTLFFSNRNYKPLIIVVGQLLGISTLIVISWVGSIAGDFISPSYIGLLGLFPIYLGIRQLFNNDGTEDVVQVKNNNMMFSIAMVTIANGGDNIGIYIPLFVVPTLFEKIGMVVIFLSMTLLWCAMAKYLTSRPLLKAALSKYGHIATPIVLILLGFYILYENQTFSLFV